MEWYKDWFNTSYYHLLYKGRNEEEANNFINNLMESLQASPNSKILDLACGKGRHAKFLADKGFEVTGLDLSTESIEKASEYETDMLSFFTHDMRKPFRTNYFNYIFNFFTSFGYFDNDKDHLDTLVNVANGLSSNGIFVMDFMNAIKVEKNLKRREQKTLQGIRFRISRTVKKGQIIKRIRFEDKGQSFLFEEKVRAYTLKELKSLFKKAGLKVYKTYGDYDLNKFKAEHSPRLILFAKKN